MNDLLATREHCDLGHITINSCKIMLWEAPTRLLFNKLHMDIASSSYIMAAEICIRKDNIDMYAFICNTEQ